LLLFNFPKRKNVLCVWPRTRPIFMRHSLCLQDPFPLALSLVPDSIFFLPLCQRECTTGPRISPFLEAYALTPICGSLH
jgi:hypothetical protein